MEERPCSICRRPLPNDPEKVFRVNWEWKNLEGELSEDVKNLAEELNDGSFCGGGCSKEVILSGLKVVSVAEIKRWGQNGKAKSLLERIGKNRKEDITALKKKFRVVEGRG